MNTRPALSAAALLGAALMLTGCLSVAPPAGPDVVAVDFGDVETAPGNVTLALGEAAGITKSNFEGTPSATVSLLEIVEGDPAIFEEWGEDGEQFEGLVPFYLVIQVTRDSDDHVEYAVYPVSETGQPTEYVVSTFGSGGLASGTAECPLTLPEHDPETRTELTCVIGLAANGEKIVGGVYNGGSYTGFEVAGSDPDYGTAPIQWSSSKAPGPIIYDAEKIDMGQAATATPPGTKVALRQPAWLPLSSDPDTIVGTSILDIIPGEPSFFERYPNVSDFDGYTPTFIVVQLQYPDDASAKARKLPPLHPKLSDGEYAEWLQSSNAMSFEQVPGLQECGLVLPTYDPETRTFVGCITATTRGDATVSLVEYDGEAYNAFFADDALGYFSDPVIFE